MSPKEQEDERGATYYKYSYELELPYGEWKLGYYYKLRSNQQAEKQELPEDQMRDTLKFKIEPEPISADQQKQLDIAEEDENKRREHEARMAQKKLEEEKARQKYEQQQLIAKQEQNTARLEVYLKVMNLAIHRVSEQLLVHVCLYRPMRNSMLLFQSCPSSISI